MSAVCDDGRVGYDGALTLACGQSASHTAGGSFVPVATVRAAAALAAVAADVDAALVAPARALRLVGEAVLGEVEALEGQALERDMPGNAPQAAFM